MFKRLAAVAALSLVPVAATAAPAQAAYGSCGISVPSKVSVYSPYRTVTGYYSAGCRKYADDATWDVVHPTQGPVDMFWFDGQTRESLDWYDWNPLGTYTVRPAGAWDSDWNAITQNTKKMTVKIGSRMSASSSRSGRYVTVKAKATRYSPNYGTFRNWSGTKVVLRQKTCSSCSWKWVKSATTNRYGQATFKAYASTSRYWQVATYDTSSTWGRTSARMTR